MISRSLLVIRLLSWGLLSCGLLAWTPARSEAAAEITPEQIKEVAADMVCLCGSCNRESLATCVCTAFAVPQRAAIGRLLVEGESPEQIVAGYVESFGTQVLASPPGGYRVVGFLTPVVILLVGVVVVRTVLVSWRRSPKAAESGETPPAKGDQYSERLKRDLDSFDGG